MPGHVRKDPRKYANAYGVVIRQGYVVLSRLLRRKPHVGSCLSCYLVAKVLKQAGQFTGRDISRELHAAITSSFTK